MRSGFWNKIKAFGEIRLTAAAQLVRENLTGAATVVNLSINSPIARVQELTVTGAVAPDVIFVELNHATVVIAATLADPAAHAGIVFVVKNTSASGTAAHTVTLATGTWDGTNNVATLNAPDEQLAVIFDSNGKGIVLVNTGTVGLS